jgi:hypothetical protein
MRANFSRHYFTMICCWFFHAGTLFASSIAVTSRPFPNAGPTLTVYTSIRLDSTRFIFLQNVLFCAGLSSTENLLNRTLIRIILWAIAIFTLIGNSLVLLGRGILKDENKVPLNFIRSLAGSYSSFMTHTV